MRKTIYAVLTVAALTSTAFALPNGFAKLSLTAQQKEKLAKIATTYRAQISPISDQIKDLSAQVKALRDKQHAEELDVLTDAQRQQLADNITRRTPAAQPTPPQAAAK